MKKSNTNQVRFARILLLMISICILSTPLLADDIAKKKGFITIATIGANPASISAGTKSQDVVKKMIAHWRGRFAQILPDKPDLIVVPEACDRPGGFSSEKLKEYYKVRHIIQTYPRKPTKRK